MTIAFSRLRILASISLMSIFFNMVTSFLGYSRADSNRRNRVQSPARLTATQRECGRRRDREATRPRRPLCCPAQENSLKEENGRCVGGCNLRRTITYWRCSYINVVAVTYKCDENQSSNMVQISVRPKTKQKLLEIQERDEQTSMDGVIRYLLFKAGEERDS